MIEHFFTASFDTPLCSTGDNNGKRVTQAPYGQAIKRKAL